MMTAGITNDDTIHMHTVRACVICISRSFPWAVRLYDGDRIGLRILRLPSLSKSDFVNLRAEVAKLFGEPEIVPRDEPLEDNI